MNTSRNLFDDVDCIGSVVTNPMFIGVSIFSALLQVLIVEYEPFHFNSLTAAQWGWTIFLGWGSMLFGIAQRFIDKGIQTLSSTMMAQLARMTPLLPLVVPALQRRLTARGTRWSTLPE